MEVSEVGRRKKIVSDPNRKPVAVTIKGDLAWRNWLEGGAKHVHMPISVLIDNAVIQYLKDRGYEASPPDRLAGLPPQPTPGEG